MIRSIQWKQLLKDPNSVSFLRRCGDGCEETNNDVHMRHDISTVRVDIFCSVFSISMIAMRMIRNTKQRKVGEGGVYSLNLNGNMRMISFAVVVLWVAAASYVDAFNFSPSWSRHTGRGSRGGHYRNSRPSLRPSLNQFASSTKLSSSNDGNENNDNDCDADDHSNIDRTHLIKSRTKSSSFSRNFVPTATSQSVSTRRHVLTSSFKSFLIAAVTIGGTTTITDKNPSSIARAIGLVQFPCVEPLLNKYYLMRSGTTLLEEQDIWSTNPLFLTNREAALSEKGVAEVQEACKILAQNDILPSVVKYSLAASAMDTAQIMKEDSALRIGQNRLIPEFTFMDPRAIGKWDMLSLEATQKAVFAMDDEKAGKDGKGGRPPPNDDGTPHETLADQSIRLRQLLSGT